MTALCGGGAMSYTYEFAYLLPNVSFKHPIENEYLALVPPDDERLAALVDRHPAVQKLASGFTDQFKRPLMPSALLVRSDAPSTVDFYAVACFRNLVAISSLLEGWTMRLARGTAGYPLWSDYFDFYSFTATKDGKDLIAKSMASNEADIPDDFAGQRSPHLPNPDRLHFGTEEVILKGCLPYWRKCFVRGRWSWRTRVLFRSLEMACQASRVPAVWTRMPTIHDLGVGISLWVSSMEILSHPGRKGRADLGTVIGLLSKAHWYDLKLAARRYHMKLGKNQLRVNRICKLYKELYRARNDFLHGNPVKHGKLVPSGKAKGLLLPHIAPLIYRAGLVTFLSEGNQRWRKSIGRDPMAERALMRQQEKYEKAVLTCL
jgi:hypothetical protein